MDVALPMDHCAAALRWIETQDDFMRRLVRAWSEINSGSGHVAGLSKMADAIEPLLMHVGDTRRVKLPPRQTVDDAGVLSEAQVGPALQSVWTGAQARVRLLLGIHFDTVYEPNHPFQACELFGSDMLRGPGVTDAKGGLIVLLTALRAVRETEWAARLAWEVVLNPDEELGSPSSAGLWAECARRADIGLLFEPALPDGSLVSHRKGSSSFAVVVRGRAAHVGRDPTAGRNAIHAIAGFVAAAAEIPNHLSGVIVNVGKIAGGGPTNVVPDRAVCRLNLRAESRQQQDRAHQLLAEQVESLTRMDGISAEIFTTSQCPPKLLDAATESLLAAASLCGRELQIGPLQSFPSGGVSDGNRLAALGLPTLDTLGVRGGKIHSGEEYLHLDSLVERAKLAALLMIKLAAGEVRIAGRGVRS